MATVTDQAIPPDLLADWQALSATTPGPAPGTSRVRAQRAALGRVRRPSDRTVRAAIIDAIVRTTTIRDALPPTAARAAAAASVDAALLGFGATPWLTPAYRESHVIYSATATAAPDPSPPPYSWRDPTMPPAAVTYAAPTTTPAAAPSAGGYYDAGTWHEDAFAWSYDTIIWPPTDARDPAADALITGHHTVWITTHRRPSRPMASITLRITHHADTDTPTAPPTAPVPRAHVSDPALHRAPRYLYAERSPPGVWYRNPSWPPEDPQNQWRATVPSTLSLYIPPPRISTPPPPHPRTTVEYGPRPPLGRAQNNNLYVELTTDWRYRAYVPRRTPAPGPYLLTLPSPVSREIIHAPTGWQRTMTPAKSDTTYVAARAYLLVLRPTGYAQSLDQHGQPIADTMWPPTWIAAAPSATPCADGLALRADATIYLIDASLSPVAGGPADPAAAARYAADGWLPGKSWHHWAMRSGSTWSWMLDDAPLDPITPPPTTPAIYIAAESTLWALSGSAAPYTLYATPWGQSTWSPIATIYDAPDTWAPAADGALWAAKKTDIVTMALTRYDPAGGPQLSYARFAAHALDPASVLR